MSKISLWGHQLCDCEKPLFNKSYTSGIYGPECGNCGLYTERQHIPHYNDSPFIDLPICTILKTLPIRTTVPMIPFKKLDPNAKAPTRANTTDAGLDLYALEDTIVYSIPRTAIRYMIGWVLEYAATLFTRPPNRFLPNDTKEYEFAATKVKTGIALEIPDGCYGQILDRSSMGSKLLKVFGGVIDSGWRGDMTVCLGNFSFNDYKISAGDKIAQVVIKKYESLVPIEVNELSASDRGEKGFGSSGK